MHLLFIPLLLHFQLAFSQQKDRASSEYEDEYSDSSTRSKLPVKQPKILGPENLRLLDEKVRVSMLSLCNEHADLGQSHGGKFGTVSS